MKRLTNQVPIGKTCWMETTHFPRVHRQRTGFEDSALAQWHVPVTPPEHLNAQVADEPLAPGDYYLEINGKRIHASEMHKPTRTPKPTAQPIAMSADEPSGNASEHHRSEFARGGYILWIAGAWRSVQIIKTGERFLTAIVDGGRMTLHNEWFWVAPGSAPVAVKLKPVNESWQIDNEKQATFDRWQYQLLECGMSPEEATLRALLAAGVAA